MIYGVIALWIILLVVIVVAFVKKIKQLNNDYDSLSEQYDAYKKSLGDEKQLEANINTCEKELRNIRDELSRYYTTSRELENIQRIKLEESFGSLNNSIAEKREEEQTIQSKINENKILVKKLTDSIETLGNEALVMSNKLQVLTEQLNSACKQHKEATSRLSETNCGKMLDCEPKDIELTSILDNLKIQYPQLNDAFSAIEWSKIWQIKFQAMTNDLLKADKCGIYRIFTIDSGGEKSYIGQARKIRERWSQHIKRMLGVEKSDNNKFYSAVRPWDAHFEIVEECTEQELNAKEHYWIDYYNCVEQGYNTRT